ncbi:hypothetical protein [Mesorhizobium sp.]|uniref:hypothetical protein n=1 Tax=Mesorhizobium sp. TaxID=1871066 RepID=UPI000FE4BD69|nr:hypothetical protein [Mesorhizobium sp.]RWP05108.1 MAG: hypothetical protein EOQ99_16695 [Mesorhizobium sp.]
MPFDGSGNFNRVMNWVNDAAAGIKIKSDRHDAEDDNLAAGLSNTLTKDGQSQPTANIPMNGKKLVNLGAPTAATDAATKGYADTANALKAPLASPTFTGKVTLPAATAAGNGVNVPTGVAPTTPSHGDLWNTAVGWFTRITGVTYTFGMLEAAQTWTSVQTFSAGVNVGTGTGGQTNVNNTALELGIGRSTDGSTFVDFHAQNPDVDFSARIIRDSGANGSLQIHNNGTGGVAFTSGGAAGTFTYNAVPILVGNLDNLALTAGFAMSTYANDGTKSGGATYIPLPAAGGNMRQVSNGGPFTLAADASAPANTSYTLILYITNVASAGAITLSGWSKSSGDPFDVTVGSTFLCYITRLGGVRTITVEKVA